MRANCCICGHFVENDADYSVPFGSVRDTEPPDEMFYCASCAEGQEEFWVKRGGLAPCDWIPSKWQRRVAERLGRVYAGPKGAAWGMFMAPDEIPEDWGIMG